MNARITWLGKVELSDGRMGTLVCGPDKRGYTIRTATTLVHVAANAVQIQINKGGNYIPGDAIGTGTSVGA